MFTVKLPKDIEKRLDDLAHKTGRTKTYYVRKAITNYIADMEDFYLGLQRLEKPAKR